MLPGELLVRIPFVRRIATLVAAVGLGFDLELLGKCDGCGDCFSGCNGRCLSSVGLTTFGVLWAFPATWSMCRVNLRYVVGIGFDALERTR